MECNEEDVDNNDEGRRQRQWLDQRVNDNGDGVWWMLLVGPLLTTVLGRGCSMEAMQDDSDKMDTCDFMDNKQMNGGDA